MKPARRYKATSRRRSRRRHNRGPGSRLFGLLVGLALVGWAGFHAAERFPEYLGPVVAATSLQKLQGPVSHVRDGDTIEVNGVPVRFGSLDCPEMNTSAGRRAAERMRALVSDEILTCHLNGRASYDRKIGSCRLPDGRDIGAVMMGEGLCRRFW